LGGAPDGYVTLVKKSLDEKHKDLGIQVINAGISGHRVPNLQKRLQRDVLNHKPNVVVIYIGINDVWHAARGTPAPAYEAGLKDLITRIKAGGAKVVLCTPTVIGEKKDGGNGFDKQLDQYSDISRKVAAENEVPLIDLRKAFVEWLAQNNPNNVDKGLLTGDTVHLNKAGNALVAEKMLAGLGVAK
jgi:lysophospholipase L1-like esterase